MSEPVIVRVQGNELWSCKHNLLSICTNGNSPNIALLLQASADWMQTTLVHKVCIDFYKIETETKYPTFDRQQFLKKGPWT